MAKKPKRSSSKEKPTVDAVRDAVVFRAEVFEALDKITAVRGFRGGHQLRELVRRIPKDAQAGELDWGMPHGREEAW